MTHVPLRLGDLTALVVGRSSGAPPIELLAEAHAIAIELNRLADHLLGHFVDDARRSGVSWNDIGDVIGVTKQAAQQRFVSSQSAGPAMSRGQVFVNYTERAKRAVVLAREAALAASSPFIGTEHLLLGACAQPTGFGAQLTDAMGTSRAELRAAAEAELGDGVDDVPDPLPFTRPASKVLVLTQRESLLLGHDHVGIEHLFLGLVAEEDGAAGAILRRLGWTLQAARDHVIRILTEAVCHSFG
jgi:hypothetical protein